MSRVGVSARCKPGIELGGGFDEGSQSFWDTSSLCVEVVSVNVLHFVGVRLGNPNVVLDHEVSKSGSIDQYHFLRNLLSVRP